jgi:membrane-bound lytic murein transglycosylase B
MCCTGAYSFAKTDARKLPFPRSLGMFAIALGLILSTSPGAGALGASPFFVKLQERLVADGLEAQFVQTLYDNPLVKLEPEILAANLKRSEAVLNYDQFLTPTAVGRAARYVEQHRSALEGAQRRNGVPSGVIVAILMVETSLGEQTGRFPIFNVLSTMAVGDDPQVRTLVLESLSPEDRKQQTDEVISQRLERRIARGYQELKAFLEYARRNQVDPLAVRGSSEGAIGIPQFLPSNISLYGKDGDGDGTVDLFNHEDAIASVASFLDMHQWRQAHGAKEKKRVLLHYNRSKYYVDTVYALAKRLKDRAVAENGSQQRRAEAASPGEAESISAIPPSPQH